MTERITRIDQKIKCPCCGKAYVGLFDICDVCGWENDDLQLENPDFSGGANKMSLNEAKKVFEQGGKVD